LSTLFAIQHVEATAMSDALVIASADVLHKACQALHISIGASNTYHTNNSEPFRATQSSSMHFFHQ
jgi:hypothetical protein